MADKIKLNKNALREQNQALRLYEEFLPTLELRKQQLQHELRRVEGTLRARRASLQAQIDATEPWRALLGRDQRALQQVVRVEAIERGETSLAGVRVPTLHEVRFSPLRYSRVGTPPSFDASVRFLQSAIEAQISIALTLEQRSRLQAELTRTTQRINLYEKVLIPEARHNIRRIKVYLGDQQTAAVCRAKIAKAKLVAKSSQEGH